MNFEGTWYTTSKKHNFTITQEGPGLYQVTAWDHHNHKLVVVGEKVTFNKHHGHIVD